MGKEKLTGADAFLNDLGQNKVKKIDHILAGLIGVEYPDENERGGDRPKKKDTPPKQEFVLDESGNIVEKIK